MKAKLVRQTYLDTQQQQQQQQLQAQRTMAALAAHGHGCLGDGRTRMVLCMEGIMLQAGWLSQQAGQLAVGAAGSCVLGHAYCWCMQWHGMVGEAIAGHMGAGQGTTTMHWAAGCP